MSKEIPVEVISENSLYKSEGKVYPREVNGRFTLICYVGVFGFVCIF